MATLPWIGSLAKEIGKDKVTVTTLVKPNQDPHLIEVKPSMILAGRKADILMYNGLDMEQRGIIFVDLALAQFIGIGIALSFVFEGKGGFILEFLFFASFAVVLVKSVHSPAFSNPICWISPRRRLSWQDWHCGFLRCWLLRYFGSRPGGHG